MRIKIRQAIVFRYAEPAASALQLLRLTPRPHDGQFVRRWRVGVDIDARLDKSEDAYGNTTHLVFLDGPLTRVEIVIEGEVDTMETHGVVRGTVERQPLGLFVRETALTRPTLAMQALAQEASQTAGQDALATMHALNERLHTEMALRAIGPEPQATAAQAYEAGAGSPRDLAQVLIAAARSVGIPARLVSGYLLSKERVETQSGHAWMEAHIPGLGWVGFDPAEGRCVTERYVRTATGCDAIEAAPVRGARIGGLDEELDIAILIEQGRSVAQA